MEWLVTPKAVGEPILVLSFDAIITLDGKEDVRNVTTLRKRIKVDVGWPETVGEWLEYVKKTGENVSWIWASLLIPVGSVRHGIWSGGDRNRMTSAGRTPDN